MLTSASVGSMISEPPDGKRDPLLVDLVDLLFELIAGEDGTLFLVQLDALLALGHGLAEELLGLLVGLLAVDEHLIDIVGEIVADGADDQPAVAVDFARPAGLGCRFLISSYSSSRFSRSLCNSSGVRPTASVRMI